MSRIGNENFHQAVANPGDRQTTHDHGRCRSDQRYQPAAELEGADDEFSGDPGEQSEWDHDRHGHRRQPGTGRDQERE